MYKPTPRQIEVYGLEKTQGRYYEKEEIFAGTFRANIGRSCDVVLWDWTLWNACIISVDEEGYCRVQSCLNQTSQILVYIGSADDMHQEQRKIRTLTIWPIHPVEETHGHDEKERLTFPTEKKEGQHIHRENEPFGFYNNEKHKIGEFEVGMSNSTIEKIQHMEEIGAGPVFRFLMGVFLFIPQFVVAILFCLSLHRGHYVIAAFVLIVFYNISVANTVTKMVLKSFKK